MKWKLGLCRGLEGCIGATVNIRFNAGPSVNSGHEAQSCSFSIGLNRVPNKEFVSISFL